MSFWPYGDVEAGHITIVLANLLELAVQSKKIIALEPPAANEPAFRVAASFATPNPLRLKASFVVSAL